MSDTNNASTEGDSQGTETETTGAENTAGETTEGSTTGRAGSDISLKADLANERKARQAEARKAKDLEARLAKFEEATKGETEKLLDRARQEGASEALKSANVKIARMAIRAAAADKLADPSDADVLDATQFTVDDDGNVDTKAVNAELDRLLKDKPHWAKVTKQGAGSADQGARGNAARPTDMNALIRQQMGRG